MTFVVKAPFSDESPALTVVLQAHAAGSLAITGQVLSVVSKLRRSLGPFQGTNRDRGVLRGSWRSSPHLSASQREGPAGCEAQVRHAGTSQRLPCESVAGIVRPSAR